LYIQYIQYFVMRVLYLCTLIYLCNIFYILLSLRINSEQRTNERIN